MNCVFLIPISSIYSKFFICDWVVLAMGIHGAKKDAIVRLARLHLLIFYPVWGGLFYCANAFGI